MSKSHGCILLKIRWSQIIAVRRRTTFIVAKQRCLSQEPRSSGQTKYGFYEETSRLHLDSQTSYEIVVVLKCRSLPVNQEKPVPALFDINRTLFLLILLHLCQNYRRTRRDSFLLPTHSRPGTLNMSMSSQCPPKGMCRFTRSPRGTFELTSWKFYEF